MKRTVKVCACINDISPLNISRNAETAIAEIKNHKESNADLYILPPLFLTGGELGDSCTRKSFLSACKSELETIASYFSKEKFGILAGLPSEYGFVLAFLQNGRVRYEHNGLLSFEIQSNKCTAAGGEKGFSRSAEIASTPTDIFILCDYSPAIAGVDRIIENDILAFSKALGISCCFVRGGRGDTSYPDIYRAAAGFCRDGNEVKFYKGNEAFGVCSSLGGVLSEQPTTPVIDLPNTKPFTLPIEIQKRPFIPLGEREDLYCLDVFDLQCLSLANRLKNLKIDKVVLGVSGGLDSCLALMVCAGAMQKLGLPNENITALIMPGFGTSERTLANSRTLCAEVGATVQEIDIQASAKDIFSVIGHDETLHDVVFENTQARLRTTIALTVANQLNGIMVGTGDLSELALGFSTYGGDHLASYNVNVCIPKSLIRVMLPIITSSELFASTSLVVQDILETPISPELLPLDENMEIAQKTEDILAPYELLDFFLYCFIAAKLSRSRTLELAMRYFANEHSAEYLSQKLDMFLKRFLASQFKRNCAPEAARITSVHLSQGSVSFPSDVSDEILPFLL